MVVGEDETDGHDHATPAGKGTAISTRDPAALDSIVMPPPSAAARSRRLTGPAFYVVSIA